MRSVEKPENRGQEEFPVPSPGSAFYLPPTSSRALRWSVVLFLLGPLFLAFAAIESVLAHEWTLVIIALVMLCAYGLLKSFQIRAILCELMCRRRGDRSAG